VINTVSVRYVHVSITAITLECVVTTNWPHETATYTVS